jgi:hypothetical protein
MNDLRQSEADNDVDYRALLKWDEEHLFRNLVDPHGHEELPRRGYGPVMATLADSSGPYRFRIPRLSRRYRIEAHRYMARELISLAQQEQDAARRGKYERAAQLNEAFAQRSNRWRQNPSMRRPLYLIDLTRRQWNSIGFKRSNGSFNGGGLAIGPVESGA